MTMPRFRLKLWMLMVAVILAAMALVIARDRRVSVRGMVYNNSRPIPVGRIEFVTLDPGGGEGPVFGTEFADGSYAIRLPAGRYKARFSSPLAPGKPHVSAGDITFSETSETCDFELFPWLQPPISAAPK